MAERRLSVSLHQPGPIALEVDFHCDPGDVLAIFGASGSGKTTILRSIAGLYRPAQARVTAGREIWCDTATQRFLPPHDRAVGVVFQEYALFPHLTAAGNVMTALGHLPRAARRARADALLAQVRLSQHANRRPSQLSGGERQRVALARALAREPAALLLDEPFAATDRAVRHHLQDEVDRLRRTTDVPMILVTHDLGDVVRLATHLLILDHGRSAASGPLATLMSRPDLTWLRDLIGLGSLIEGEVAAIHTERGLIELAFDGGHLLAPGHSPAVGTRVRLRVPAREVILATKPPEGLSLHNVIAGSVASIQPGADQVVVQLAVGRVLILAEVTRDAAMTLGLQVGMPLYALIKSVSLELLGSAAPDPP